MLAAQIIRVTGKVDSIGFTLTPFPPYTLGQISGQVVDTSGGSNTPVISRVMAFRDRWYFEDSLLTSRVYEADSDSLGQFAIPSLLPGTYRILAVPLGAYVPTFYSAVMPSRSWAQSIPVTVSGNSTGGLQLITKPIPDSARGYAGITGTVTGNSGASNSRVNNASAAAVSAAAVPGSIVYATDQVGRYSRIRYNGRHWKLFNQRIGSRFIQRDCRCYRPFDVHDTIGINVVRLERKSSRWFGIVCYERRDISAAAAAIQCDSEIVRVESKLSQSIQSFNDDIVFHSARIKSKLESIQHSWPGGRDIS